MKYRSNFTATLSMVMVFALAPWATGQTCEEPSWAAGMFGFPGPDGTVHSLIVHDDGTGSALYIGGVFNDAGGLPAHGIVRWNGRQYSMVGPGFGIADGVAHTNSVGSMVVFDDGTGPMLYAGGAFVSTFGSPIDYLARWDGRRWSEVGGGVNGIVRDLEVFDAGDGPRLILLSNYSSVGGMAAGYLAQWTGTEWLAIGDLQFLAVLAMEILPTDSGQRLVVVGRTSNNPVGNYYQAYQWDGLQWTKLGDEFNDSVYGLAVHDDGNGLSLFASGYFTMAGEQPCNHVARWTGVEWVPVGDGLSALVSKLTVADLGQGQVLIATGNFVLTPGGATEYNAYWDGEHWNSNADRLTGSVYATAEFEIDGETRSFLGGSRLGNYWSGFIEWMGDSWQPVGGSVVEEVSNWFENVSNVVQAFDDGSGPALYVAPQWYSGQWDHVLSHSSIVRWKSGTWSAVPEEGHFLTGQDHAMEVFDDGVNPSLFVGGWFGLNDSNGWHGVYAWDGHEWATPGGGVGGPVFCMTSHADVGGSSLFVGGQFELAGDVHAHSVARWDGHEWSAIGDPPLEAVTSLAIGGFGNGLELFIAAREMWDSAGSDSIYRWCGGEWENIGAPPHWSDDDSPGVGAMAVFDDGSGPKLIVAPYNEWPDTIPISLGEWDGTSWSEMPGGFWGTTLDFLGITVHTLKVIDSGGGPELYAVGPFTNVGALRANGIARWDGHQWHPVGGGVTECHWSNSHRRDVRDITLFDDGTGPALFVTGHIGCAGGGESVGIAKFGCHTWQPGFGDVDFDGDVDLADYWLMNECWGRNLYSNGDCDPFRVYAGNYVRLDDFGGIQRSFTGEN